MVTATSCCFGYVIWRQGKNLKCPKLTRSAPKGGRNEKTSFRIGDINITYSGKKEFKSSPQQKWPPENSE